MSKLVYFQIKLTELVEKLTSIINKCLSALGQNSVTVKEVTQIIMNYLKWISKSDDIRFLLSSGIIITTKMFISFETNKKYNSQ